jgi:putative endonuclease
MQTKSQIGKQGEQIAMEYLRRQGFLIADVNWRSGRYEIDIVAQKGGMTHFVEVKTRSALSLTTPEQALTQAKIDAMHRAVKAYLAQRRIYGEFELDLVAVDMFPDGSSDVRLIRDVAESHW